MSYYNQSKQKLEKQYSFTKKIMDYGMGIIYCSVGIFILIAEKIGIELSFPTHPFNYFFGFLIVLYGFFRLYRAFSYNRLK